MKKTMLIKKLKVVLADSYTLYLKTQNYHWNVEGPQFRSLHLLFEEQYTDLFNANDEIAERIRMLGEKAPGTFTEFLKLTTMHEADSSKNATEMMKCLVDSQVAIIKTIYAALKEAQKIGDEATTGLLTDRVQAHEKNKWFLETSLKK